MGLHTKLLLLSVLMSYMYAVRPNQSFNYRTYDKFDEVDSQMAAVNRDNCAAKSDEELHLPEESIAQAPVFNKLLVSIIYPNRTNLLHIHNMAMNRAFFFSYINQRLNKTTSFYDQPGLLYYYLSTSADISANEYGINGSAFMYDVNCTFANWYTNLAFNSTLDLFGPRAYRLDDYQDPTNYLREPTNNTIQIVDYGADSHANYTLPSYRINDWYNKYLPDPRPKNSDHSDPTFFDRSRKHSYQVDILMSNETGKFASLDYDSVVFFGPPSPGVTEQEKGHFPVQFTRPYFDCGRSNKWIVSAVSPIVDRMARYQDRWYHLRRTTFVGSVVMDIDFLQIDINPCDLSEGNPSPNYFAGTARCKPTTMCEPLHGWGFRKGGYQCMCRPGYRYPFYQRGPYQGAEIESSTQEEYENGFDCLEVDLKQVIPNKPTELTTQTPNNKRKKRSATKEDVVKAEREFISASFASSSSKLEMLGRTEAKPSHISTQTVSNVLNRKRRFLRAMGLHEVKSIEQGKRAAKIVKRESSIMREVKRRQKYTAQYKQIKLDRKKRSSFDADRHEQMKRIIFHKEEVTQENCNKYKPDDLVLPGDVSYNVDKQFSSQARTALRLAHFLSNFLQNVGIYEEYGQYRGDRPLNQHLLFGEALANVMGDLQIEGSGIFYDIDKYKERNGEIKQYFGPYGYRYKSAKQPGQGQTAKDVKTHFRAVDFAGFSDHYLNKKWFKIIKERWQSNSHGLQKFVENPMIRSDLLGTSLRKFDMYPLTYMAPAEEDGWWSAPYFDCNRFINDWIITYSVPFFGKNKLKDIEFMGVVRVDVSLNKLDINQCPMKFGVANAFKNTARCDYTNSYCVPLPGDGFRKGGYKCECRQGFEYPRDDRAWYFDGQMMEQEYRKLMKGEQNIFNTLKCRISSAESIRSTPLVYVLLTCLAYFMTKH